ncbi:hypothetical protein ABMA27_012570 [Loxostege sticticalis]|uniref:Uncharacterized protein n=1 Tax=Loxostege sticticalis TaxID=481309 RepID=A0ABR3GZ28_LOXSC
MVDLLLDIDKSLRIEGHILSYPEDCCEILNKYTLKILCVNIRSVQHNFDNFLLLLARLNTSFDAIVFSECWISDRSTIKQIEGYNSFNTQKYINKAGGVIIYVGNKWVPNVTEPDIDEANGLIVEVPNVFTLVGSLANSFYMSPTDGSEILQLIRNYATPMILPSFSGVELGLKPAVELKRVWLLFQAGCAETCSPLIRQRRSFYAFTRRLLQLLFR